MSNKNNNFIRFNFRRQIFNFKNENDDQIFLQIKNMTPERCKGFHVYPPSIFYPIFYREWTKYFESTDLESTMKLLEEAKIIHVWNKFSKHRSIRVGDKVPYAIIAERYCPRIYKSCGETF